MFKIFTFVLIIMSFSTFAFRPSLNFEVSGGLIAGNIDQDHSYDGEDLDGNPASGDREVIGSMTGFGTRLRLYQQYVNFYWGVGVDYSKAKLSSKARVLTDEDFVPLESSSDISSYSTALIGGYHWGQFRFGAGFKFLNKLKLLQDTETTRYEGLGYSFSFSFIPYWEKTGFVIGLEVTTRNLSKKNGSSLPQSYEVDNTANQGGDWVIKEKTLDTTEFLLSLGYIF